MIRINIGNVKSDIARVQSISSKLNQIESQLVSIKSGLDPRIQARLGIGASLSSTVNNVRDLETQIKALTSFLEMAAQKYERAEKHIANRALTVMRIGSEGAPGKSGSTVLEKATNSGGEKSQLTARWDLGLAEFLTHNEINLIRDLLVELPLVGLPAYYHLPRFVVDGKYLKVFNSETYHGGQGLARRYTIENIKNNKYPHATRLYRVSKWVKGVNFVSRVAPWVSGAAESYKELTTDKNISTERKVSNAVIAGGASVGVGIAGAKIGAAVGTMIAPGVGTVAGAVIGAGVGVLSAYVGDKLLKAEVWGSGNNKKSTLSVVQDVVGDGVEAVGGAVKGAAQWVGSLFGSKPNTGASTG
ncbi:bacteriocin class II family protein [Bacillus sp. EB01]|uniref:bacteriocin class II family protein n=1 Tax=Bacillus sp. EB01 TaxID=1347086 RepID=UPI0005C67428|nr:bacteriocin class II family protein [Bacillus sp. EB01]